MNIDWFRSTSERGRKGGFCRHPAAIAVSAALTSHCFSLRFSLRIWASGTSRENSTTTNPRHRSECLRRTLVFTADECGAVPFGYLLVGLDFKYIYRYIYAICGLTQHSIKERRDISLSAKLWITTLSYHGRVCLRFGILVVSICEY